MAFCIYFTMYITCPGLVSWEYGRRDVTPTTWHPLPANVGTNFADKWWSLGRYSSLVDSGHRVYITWRWVGTEQLQLYEGARTVSRRITWQVQVWSDWRTEPIFVDPYINCIVPTRLIFCSLFKTMNINFRLNRKHTCFECHFDIITERILRTNYMFASRHSLQHINMWF
jgi:hypothetical protein